MTVWIKHGKKIEARGDTAQEALWELKRNRPDDFIYPVQPEHSTEITGVHVRTGEDHMDVLELTVEAD